MNRVLRPASVLLAAAASASAVAQLPTPDPQPRTAPRAAYTEVAGTTGSVPVNRHWSEVAANATTMFVFGGRTGEGGTGTKRNDLYSWSSATNAWTQHNADGAVGAPPQRFQNAAEWDPVNSRLVIFGGQDAAGTILNDTWEWDQATNTWANTTPATSPVARKEHSLAFDPVTQTMLMFGGRDASDVSLSDTWIYVPSPVFGVAGSWTQLAPATVPPARSTHLMITRPDFGDVFMCSGTDWAAAPNRIHFLDVWRWDGLTLNWIQIVPTTSNVIHAFTGHRVAYDEIRRRVVVTGGNGISQNSATTGGAYGTAYGGSPSNWTSEFDCVTNEWKLYGAALSTTTDALIGRASRYYTAFVDGKVYMWGGQNNKTGDETDMKEYQANPIASHAVVATGCNGLSIDAAPGDEPWTCRPFDFDVAGVQPGAMVAAYVGFNQLVGAPYALSLFGIPGCAQWYLESVASFPIPNDNSGTLTGTIDLPDDPGIVVLTPMIQAFQLHGGAFSSTGVLTLGPGAN